MIGLRSIVFLTTMVVAGSLQSAAVADGTTSLLKVYGLASEQSIAGNVIAFQLYGVDLRFTFDKTKVQDAAALTAALADSTKTGRSMILQFDIDAGSFDENDGIAVFPVRDILYNGQAITAQTMASRSSLSPGLADLVRGAALEATGDHTGAIAALHRVVAAGKSDLTDSEMFSALVTDSSAKSEQGLYALGAGRDRDALLLGALLDFEALKSLSADPQGWQPQIGDLYSELGAYDEALAAYRTAPDTDRDLKLWKAIGRGAIYRARGDADRALAELDYFAKDYPSPHDMAYHYHRGWTLSSMKRWKDAIAEFSEGLLYQPDYSWAFLKRACASAALGNLEDALSDQKKGIEILDLVSQGGTESPSQKADRRYASEVADKLQASIAKKDSQKFDALCDGYWDSGEHTRERSPLLPPPKAQGNDI